MKVTMIFIPNGSQTIYEKVSKIHEYNLTINLLNNGEWESFQKKLFNFNVEVNAITNKNYIVTDKEEFQCRKDLTNNEKQYIDNDLTIHTITQNKYCDQHYITCKECPKHKICESPINGIIKSDVQTLQVINQSYSQHDMCTYGKCPQCGSLVQKQHYGDGEIDTTCNRCKIKLRW